AHPALVLLVVRLVAHALGQVLAVLAVAHEPSHHHDDGLVHLVGHDDAVALLAPSGAHAPAPPPAVRCRSTVRTRATSRRVSRTFIGLESCEVARRSRRWKSSSPSSASRARSSSGLISRRSRGLSGIRPSPIKPPPGAAPAAGWRATAWRR